MKKQFSFDKRSKDVFCANPKCSKVRGAEGVARMPIKKNVVARSPEGKPLVCYDCCVFEKTGKNRRQRKEAAVLRKARRAQVVQKSEFREAELKVLAVNA